MSKYMMRIMLVYLGLVLIPLIPVLLIYRLFGEMNYFGLEGWVKGLVSSGPIAAYLFLFHVGCRMFTRLMERVYPIRIVEVEKLLGIWTFESTTTQSGKKARGRLVASLSHGQLTFTGTLQGDANKAFGEAISEFCHLDSERKLFRMLYKAETVNEEGRWTPQECLCHLIINDFDHQEPIRMKGNWIQITGKDLNGPITLTKQMQESRQPRKVS